MSLAMNKERLDTGLPMVLWTVNCHHEGTCDLCREEHVHVHGNPYGFFGPTLRALMLAGWLLVERKVYQLPGAMMDLVCPTCASKLVLPEPRELTVQDIYHDPLTLAVYPASVLEPQP